MRRLLTVLLAAIVSTTVVLAQGGTGATSLVGAEYFYDTDPGYGQATYINNVTNGDNNLTLSVDGLSPGAHMLYVRSLESSGMWSATVSCPILLTPQRADDVVRVEYFFDTDPGYGHGSSVSAANGENALPLNISGMSMGIHHLNLRSQDAAGNWSPTLSQSLFIVSPKDADLTRVEYFFDTDPGYGQATAISGTLAADATYALPLDGLAAGAHLLCIRAMDSYGRWSSVVSTPLFVTGHPANAVAAEYFLDDNDPGVGQATPVALPADLSQPIIIAASTEGLDPGDHTITVRVLNDLGFWTTIVAGTTFTVNAPAAPEAYAVLNGDVVTFYYDTKKAERGGIDINNADLGNSGTSPYGTATTAVFDASFDAYKPISTAYWFQNCTSLTSITGIEYLHTDDVTDMSRMFYRCNHMTGLDLSSFNTANVTNMREMFNYCTSLTNLDLSSFNTANVTNMRGMFWGSSSLTSLDLGSFNTGNVTTMNSMFYDCTGLTSLNVSSFNTENVTDMYALFYNCSGLTSLDVSNFNTGNVTDMMGMFRGCSSLTSIDVTSFNTEKVTDMSLLFNDCTSLTSLDLSNFNTANATTIAVMFSGCTNLTSVDLSSFNTAKATISSFMFYNCPSLTRLDLSSFNTANITNMIFMFEKCSNLTTIYAGEGWNTGKVSQSEGMFNDCTALVGGMGTVYDANHVDAAYAHIDGGTANPGYLTDKNATPAVAEAYAVLSADSLTVTFYYDDKKAERGGIGINKDWIDGDKASPYGTATTAVFDESFDTYRPTDAAFWFMNCSSLTTITGIEYLHTDDVLYMGYMFYGCSGLTSLDVSNFNTGNVTYMDGMFSRCSSLTSLDVSNFNTANVTNMWGMFNGCGGLTSLDLSNFNTANVTDMSAMFQHCSSLTTIYAGNFDLTSMEASSSMFTGCTALVGGMGTVYDANHVDAAYAHIDGGTANPGYFTDKNATPAVTEAYAALSADSLTVTFYYDTKKAERGGFNINSAYIDDGTSPYGTATTAAFDASFDAYRPVSTAYWFMNCSSLTNITGIEYLHTDDVTDMSDMFANCYSLTSLDVSHFNTANVTDMYGMFFYCSGLTSLDVTNFNTANVMDMGYMFAGCYGLTSLDVTSFNTANVTNMNSMFRLCPELTSLDVTSFNTANVTDMGYMFGQCNGLTSLNVTNFNTANVTKMGGMFFMCSSLISLDLRSFNTQNVTDCLGIFSDCTSLAAIQAGNAAIPTEMYERVHNPNLLVYVNDESLAPAGVQNVVVGGLAKEIVLTDATTDGNYNFHVPEAFEAEKISYSHNYTQQTTPGVSRGWESLVLPFTVQTITHERNGELKPYKSQPGDKTFWLRTLTATGIKAAARIVANMPYLISMPNNTAAYDEEYCQGGVVTFASQNVTVPQTRMTVAALSDSSIVMRPTMLRVSQSPSVYALNIGEPRGSYLEGSVFERDLRSVRPFECYTEHAAGTGGSRFITLSDLNGGDATDIQHIEDVQTDEQPIYNVAGQMVSDGKQSRKLTKGVYIQHGRKVVK